MASATPVANRFEGIMETNTEDNAAPRIYLVNQVRNVRGASYCCSFALVPVFAVSLIAIINIGALITILYLGPNQFESNALKLEFLPLEIFIALAVGVILVVLFFTPKRVDRFFNWWLGYHQR
jgi:hypothetical protein